MREHMESVDGMEWLVKEASSLADLLAYLETAPISEKVDFELPPYKKTILGRMDAKRKKWVGIPKEGLAYALAHGITGYEPARGKEKRKAQTEKAVKRYVSPAPSGPRYSVPKVVAGDPLCAYRTKRVEARSKIVNLVFDISVVCDMTAEDMRKVNYLVCETVSGLEDAGYRVRITVLMGGYRGSNGHLVVLRAKDANKRLVPPMLALILGEPLMARHLYIFSVYRQDHMTDYWGCGTPLNYVSDSTMAELARRAAGKDAVYLSTEKLIKTMASIGEDRMMGYLRALFLGEDGHA